MLDARRLAAGLLLSILSLPCAAQAPAGKALPKIARAVLPAHVCPKRSLNFMPDQYQIEVRKYLAAGKLDVLEQRLVELRSSYLRSECSDRPFSVIFAAFVDGAPAMQRRFDGWVARYPKSPYALTARGMHYISRAAYARGQDWAQNTKQDRFEAMSRFLVRAESDFNGALALDTTFTDPMVGILLAKSMGSDLGAVIAAYERFLVKAPHSYVLDAGMLDALVPRWGGSVPLMMQFTEDRVAKAGSYTDESLLTSRANCLLANELATYGGPASAAESLKSGMAVAADTDVYCHFAQGMLGRKDHRHEDAVAAFARFRAQMGPVTMISREADSWLRMRQYGAAINLFTMGIQFKTASPNLFCGRAEGYLGLREIQKARQDVAVGLATDPAEPYCLRIEARIVKASRG